MKNLEFVKSILLVTAFFSTAATAVFGNQLPRDYVKQNIKAYEQKKDCKSLMIYNLVELHKDRALYKYVVEQFTAMVSNLNPDYIASPEARALPFFGAVTYLADKPGIFIRKPGKLPEAAPRITQDYDMAYAKGVSIEMVADPELVGKTVVIIDDGISSGGTTLATIQLLEKAGMKVIAILAVVQHHYRPLLPEYAPWIIKTHTLFDL